VINSLAFSQEIDPRLSKKYSQEEIQLMIKENPTDYQLLVYALDNACYITDMPSGKDEELDGSVSLDLSKEFTYLDLGLEIKNSNQYLRINGTNKMLVVKSEWVLNNELKTKK
jgi:hypothetical protein